MEGFFDKKETSSLIRSGARPVSCYTCGLHKECKTPKMEPYGNFKKFIMVIGDFPSMESDNRGRPFQSVAGHLFARTLDSLGINLKEDCLSIHSVYCRPKNGNPTRKHIEYCRDVKVLKAIQEHKPNVIILLGGDAVVSFIGHRWKNNLGKIEKWRGWQIPDRDYKAWVCPVFSPSFVESHKHAVAKVIWEADLMKAVSLWKTPLPKYKKPIIEVITNLKVLDSITSGSVVIDIETTGLKPQKEEHEIICAAVTVDGNKAYAFEIPTKKKKLKPLVRLLEDRNVDKIAANLKYEDTWLIEKLGITISPWGFDTMQGAHILDNRTGITGLKFQTYVQFGIVDYDSSVKKYLRPSGTNTSANSINQIKELVELPGGLKLLLEYCGLDTIYEARLAEQQMKILEPDGLPF